MSLPLEMHLTDNISPSYHNNVSSFDRIFWLKLKICSEQLKQAKCCSKSLQGLHTHTMVPERLSMQMPCPTLKHAPRREQRHFAVYQIDKAYNPQDPVYTLRIHRGPGQLQPVGIGTELCANTDSKWMTFSFGSHPSMGILPIIRPRPLSLRSTTEPEEDSTGEPSIKQYHITITYNNILVPLFIFTSWLWRQLTMLKMDWRTKVRGSAWVQDGDGYHTRILNIPEESWVITCAQSETDARASSFL